MLIDIPLDFIPNYDSRHDELVATLFKSHFNSAILNQNASSYCAYVSYLGSGSFSKAVCGGLMTIGEAHAPILAARMVFRHADESGMEFMISSGRKIAGFGNSFFKDKIDPSFQDLYDKLSREHKEKTDRLSYLSSIMKSHKKASIPNAAMLTAIVCEIIGCPFGLEEFFFIMARVPAWALKAAEPNKI